MHTEQFLGPLFYVESNQDKTVLLALDVNVIDNTMRWFDSNKERVFIIHAFNKQENGNIILEKESSQPEKTIYTLVPMTLEIYNQQVKNKLDKKKEFTDLQELYKELKTSTASL